MPEGRLHERGSSPEAGVQQPSWTLTARPNAACAKLG